MKETFRSRRQDSLVSKEEEDGSVSRLVLLGTVHHDPKGYGRIDRFLCAFRPDLILVELSPFGLLFRKRCRRNLRRSLLSNLRTAARRSKIEWKQALKHPRIAALHRQISLPFEYRAAGEYAVRFGVPLFLADHSRFSCRSIASWPEMLMVENLEILLSLPTAYPSSDSLYREAARRIREDASLPSPCRSPTTCSIDRRMWKMREAFLAGKILDVLHDFQPASPLHICGWRHMMSGGDIPTVREILGIHPNRCMLLDEADRT